MVSKSLINCTSVDILPNLSIRIPSVGEILYDEKNYYSLISILTATPYQYMVQLDDIGLDYTKVTDYELFKILFPICAQSDMSIIFGNQNFSDLCYMVENDIQVLYSPSNNLIINELVYNDLVETIRKIHLIKRENYKPGNETARKYLLKKERKKQQRESRRKYEPFFEDQVVALVNTSEFPYDYDSCMNLSIYRFNRSFVQIKHKIDFDKLMIGVYAGTVDTSKMTNKDCLSWISPSPIK